MGAYEKKCKARKALMRSNRTQVERLNMAKKQLEEANALIYDSVDARRAGEYLMTATAAVLALESVIEDLEGK